MNEQKVSKLNHLELWELWKEHGNIEAKKKLIENHLHIVDYVSSRLAIGLPKNISKDDLASNGVMGLIDAIDKFDYKRGFQFETYGSWRVRGAILDSLRQGDWVPRSVREKAKKIEEAFQQLEQNHLRSVNDSEMSEHLGITEKEYHTMLQEVAVMTLCSL